MNHAVILGATGGIGSALAHSLAPKYRLSLVGRNLEKLKELSRLPNSDIIPTDLSSELEVSALFDMLDPVDLLVYAAGVIKPELIKTASSEHVQRVLDANLIGLLYTLKYAESRLQEGSRVYVLGARPELITYRGFAAYAAAKAGVKALIDVAAIEMKRKTSFTLVLPKATASPFWETVGTPPKDALKPEEVANAIWQSLEQDAKSALLVG
ncbi:MAG: SDR family NAD(P)-dependent oxidoreductase [Trueperaceae bacterium]|nr:SDR family NAD(P)-dependent oxidoreductase [Trueperaceae bacterium]